MINFIFGAVSMFAILLILNINYIHKDYDTTDNPPKRSGLRIYRDQLTGCEYLASPYGMTPRLDQNGNIVCHKEGKES